MKIKNYDRQYERVFTGDDLIRKKVKLEDISVYNNIPDSVEKYQNLYQKTMSDFQKDIFSYLVRIVWLMRRFCYRDKRRVSFRRNGNFMDRAFAVFVRYYIGFDNRCLMGGYSPFNKIIGYFDDWFINFDEGNPFEEKYEYPYQYMTFECLILVYQMAERMELLKYGEDNKMRYAEFMDYVLNYISCYNEEHGDTFIFIFSNKFHNWMPYIKLVANKEKFKKK